MNTETEIVKSSENPLSITVHASKLLFNALAEVLSRPLSPVETAAVFDTINAYVGVIEDLHKAARERTLQVILENGNPTSEKGAVRAIVGDWELSAIPQKTSLEDGKVEALLRAKGLDPHEHMDTEVKYRTNTGKLDRLVGAGQLTQGEIDACRPTLKYRVNSPKKVRSPL